MRRFDLDSEETQGTIGANETSSKRAKSESRRQVHLLGAALPHLAAYLEDDDILVLLKTARFIFDQMKPLWGTVILPHSKSVQKFMSRTKQGFTSIVQKPMCIPPPGMQPWVFLQLIHEEKCWCCKKILEHRGRDGNDEFSACDNFVVCGSCIRKKLSFETAKDDPLALYSLAESEAYAPGVSAPPGFRRATFVREVSGSREVIPKIWLDWVLRDDPFAQKRKEVQRRARDAATEHLMRSPAVAGLTELLGGPAEWLQSHPLVDEIRNGIVHLDTDASFVAHILKESEELYGWAQNMLDSMHPLTKDHADFGSLLNHRSESDVEARKQVFLQCKKHSNLIYALESWEGPLHHEFVQNYYTLDLSLVPNKVFLALHPRMKREQWLQKFAKRLGLHSNDAKYFSQVTNLTGEKIDVIHAVERKQKVSNMFQGEMLDLALQDQEVISWVFGASHEDFTMLELAQRFQCRYLLQAKGRHHGTRLAGFCKLPYALSALEDKIGAADRAEALDSYKAAKLDELPLASLEFICKSYPIEPISIENPAWFDDEEYRKAVNEDPRLVRMDYKRTYDDFQGHSVLSNNDTPQTFAQLINKADSKALIHVILGTARHQEYAMGRLKASLDNDELSYAQADMLIEAIGKGKLSIQPQSLAYAIKASSRALQVMKILNQQPAWLRDILLEAVPSVIDAFRLPRLLDAVQALSYHVAQKKVPRLESLQEHSELVSYLFRKCLICIVQQETEDLCKPHIFTEIGDTIADLHKEIEESHWWQEGHHAQLYALLDPLKRLRDMKEFLVNENIARDACRDFNINITSPAVSYRQCLRNLQESQGWRARFEQLLKRTRETKWNGIGICPPKLIERLENTALTQGYAASTIELYTETLAATKFTEGNLEDTVVLETLFDSGLLSLLHEGQFALAARRMGYYLPSAELVYLDLKEDLNLAM